MGRINTKAALNERKKLLDTQGWFVSKAGNVCRKLGAINPNTEAAREASAIARQNEKMAWKATSVAYRWVMEKWQLAWPRQRIIEEFNKLNALQPDVFCTRTGKPLTKALLSLWISEANALVV